MIRNISAAPVKIKWDGKEYTIAPGSRVDIGTVFPLLTTEVGAMESRFIGKNVGKLVIVNPYSNEPVQPVVIPAAAKAVNPDPEKDPFEEVKHDLIDPYSERKLADHSRDELLAMAKAMGLKKITKKTSKEQLIQMIDEKLEAE